MKESNLFSDILSLLPYSEPFLFVDELLEVNEEMVIGTYTYSNDLDLYRGHFSDYPVTPGVILTETMAQIGVVCLGIFLIMENGLKGNLQIAMTSSDIEYLLPVYPGEKVFVRSKKIYFRFGKLKCEVEMHNAENKVVCTGVIAGIFRNK